MAEVRVPLEDWDGAKGRIRRDPEWQKWLVRKQAEVDEWRGPRRDRVEWIAGVRSDLVNPKDGRSLAWSPKWSTPEDFIKGQPGIAASRPLREAWVYYFRRHHAERLSDAARLFRLTGDMVYRDWVVSQLDFYAANYSKWPLQTRNGKARLMAQSVDEAVLLIAYADVIHILGKDLPEASKHRWQEGLFKPAADLLETSFQQIHNIACWQRSAVGQIALAFDNNELWRKAVDGPFGIRRQIAEGVTGDHLWFEQSLAYHDYTVQALLSFMERAALAGRSGELQKETRIVADMLQAPALLRFPTGTLPNPGDSIGGPFKSPNLSLLANAYRVFPTPLGLATALRQFNWDTLVDPPTPPAGMTALPEVRSRNLEASRMALLRRGHWQVFFLYGQLSASHAQAEALNFEATYRDTDITHDSGTVSYGQPIHKDYYQTGLAHNVPLINGFGQARWDRGELLAFNEAGVVRARQLTYRSGTSAERQIDVQGGSLIDSVSIETTAFGEKPQRLGLALHVQGTVKLPEGFAVDQTFSQLKPPSFSYWSKVRTAGFRDRAVFDTQFGNQKMRITFSVPGAFKISHGLAPDPLQKTHEAFYLEKEATATTFKTIIEPVGD